MGRFITGLAATTAAAVSLTGLAVLFGSIGVRSISNASREYQDNTDFAYLAFGVILLVTAAGLSLAAVFLVVEVTRTWRRKP